MERKPSFSPSSSSSPPAKRFDVFLSFRGEDTRNNFTGHLSHALRKIGLFNIFKDDYALDKGKEIGPELLNAIEDSHYAVVVLSENYADSHWCLKELAKIVECMGDSGRIRTIFYRVDPSHVRNQKGSFGLAMEKHEKDPRQSSEEVQSWRKALTKVANQSGETVQSHRDEAIFIEEFIKKISSELGASIRTIEGLFGMTSRLKKLDSYILPYLDTDQVCFLGIHGMGGIGKSTLAKAYYKRMSHKFDGNSFLQNVREVCSKKANGLVDLQNQLLKDILKCDFAQIRDVDDGIDMIRSRLRCKKVLIVLDDVSNEEQLNVLAEQANWFSSGSVIIVTTREDSFLKIRRYEIYRAEYLNHKEALQLFSWKAFRSIEPPEDYKQLSEQVIEYASYLPLALTVLGSLLGPKDKSLWNGALCRLSNCPEKKIVEKLKISFDDLNETDKRIFLDIACFFNRRNIDNVTEILDSCGFHSEYGISNLIDKSLLSINQHGKIWMHDLLEEMGKGIVVEESGNELRRQSRIWEPVDLSQILKFKEGTNKVEAIVIHAGKLEVVEGLSYMEKLRLLEIAGLNLYGLDDCIGPELSNNLKYLRWDSFPYKEFPSSFQPPKLVQLKLVDSSIEQLWNDDVKPLSNLKVIDLSYSDSITKFGGFTLFPNLETLILRGCSRLSKIHPSIKHLQKLILLDLSFCTSLENLPEEITGLATLQTLQLYCCDKLEKLPDNLEKLKSLRILGIKYTRIKHLPSSIFLLENLESVDCNKEEMIESAMRKKIISYHTTGGCFFPGWFCNLVASLTELDLSDCNLTGPEAFVGKLASLEYLDLNKNPFSILPAWINELSSLKILRLEHCKSLICLEAELLPCSLEVVYVDFCTSLVSFLDPSKPCHLQFSSVCCLDCTELVKRQDGKMTALASLGRFLEDPSKRRDEGFQFVVPQSDNELPSWFINQSSTSSVSIKLDPNWRYSELIGIAMVFCFRANPYTEDEFSCNIRVRCSTNWITLATMELGFIKSRMSDHLFLLYNPCEKILKRIKQLGRQSCNILEFSFLPAYDVHYSSCGPCGVRLVYEKDIEELNEITSQYKNHQKDVQSSHSQSISQVCKFRLMGPIGSALWTGLKGILDADDNLELVEMQRNAQELRLLGPMSGLEGISYVDDDLELVEMQPYAQELGLMGPIGSPLWTGLEGISDADDDLESVEMQQYAQEDQPNPESNPSTVGNIHFGVFREYTGITTKFLDNLKSGRKPSNHKVVS